MSHSWPLGLVNTEHFICVGFLVESVTAQSVPVSDCGQTATGKGTYDQSVVPIELYFTMQTHYLHLAAFTCDACNGPVIAGSFATRETEIERETDIREIGAVCLLCRKQYGSFPASRSVRHLAPVEWGSREPAPKHQVSDPEPESVVKHYIQ